MALRKDCGFRLVAHPGSLVPKSFDRIEPRPRARTGREVARSESVSAMTTTAAVSPGSISAGRPQKEMRAPARTAQVLVSHEMELPDRLDVEADEQADTNPSRCR